MSEERRWYVGVDWGSEEHHVWLTDGAGIKLGERRFQHGGEGLAELAAWLLAISGADVPEQVRAAIEVPHGPVVEALMERCRMAVRAASPPPPTSIRGRSSGWPPTGNHQMLKQCRPA